jgi:hypothetical protein
MSKGSKQERQAGNKERHEQGHAVKVAFKEQAQENVGKRELDKTTALVTSAVENLRTVRDLRAIAKASNKTRLTKIERHQALLVDLLKDLQNAYGRGEK